MPARQVSAARLLGERQMKRVEYVIDENLLVIVTHAAIGDFQIGGDGHRLVDREEGIEIVVLENVTAALLRAPVAHLQHTFDAVRSAKLQQKVFIIYERMLIKTGLIGKLYGKSVQFSANHIHQLVAQSNQGISVQMTTKVFFIRFFSP